MNKKVLVAGSINMDLTVRSDEIPGIGETVMGKELLQIPGGKGANQATAIAKQGIKTFYLGKIGRDAYGEAMLESMQKSGIITDDIETSDETTGIAVIHVDNAGNNNIVVVPGANGDVDPAYFDRHKDIFEAADVVLFQFEIPMETVRYGLKLAKDLGKTTIVNPAPAAKLDSDMIDMIDILIPNEHELARIAGTDVTNADEAIMASKKLLRSGVKIIITTLGSAGVLYVSEKEERLYPAYRVDVVDTTAAGDSFIGGFIAEYMETGDIENAVDRGQRTAALAIGKCGAQSSIPTKEEVDAFEKKGN